MPAMLGEETLLAHPRRATDKAEHPPADVWEDPVGDFGIEVGQALLRYSRPRPEHPFGMRELASGRLTTAVGVNFCWDGFEADLFRRAILADAKPDRLADQLVGRPAAEFDFANEPGRGPAHPLFRPGRKTIAERWFRRGDLIELGTQRARLIAR